MGIGLFAPPSDVGLCGASTIAQESPNALLWRTWLYLPSLIARPGRWSGCPCKGYNPPGPETMHHGLSRLVKS